MIKDEIIKSLRDMARYPTVTLPRDCEALRAAADFLAQLAFVQPVAWMDVDEKGAMSGLRYWSEPDNRHEVALYTTPPQRTEERNFCPRCGKRAGDYIHTCTPPQD